MGPKDGPLAGRLAMRTGLPSEARELPGLIEIPTRIA
jgi:hypothetical protein